MAWRSPWLIDAPRPSPPLSAAAFEPIEWGKLTIAPSFNTRLGLQHGDNVNYGLGALDSLGETERSVLYLALKPQFTLDFASSQSQHAYAGFSYGTIHLSAPPSAT